MVSREGRVDRRELKGMGDSVAWHEGSMEIKREWDTKFGTFTFVFF